MRSSCEKLFIKMVHLFLMIFLAFRLIASENDAVQPATQVLVCEGGNIPLFLTFENIKGRIIFSKFYKNGGGIEDRMEKDGDKEPVLADRVVYRNRTEIIIKQATALDSGPYEAHVIFADGRISYHRFIVKVFTGCPARSEYHDPVIYFKRNNGPLEDLRDKKSFHLQAPTMVTFNVSIPKANLPVMCKITGNNHSITRQGSRQSTAYCLATFHYNDQGNDTVQLRLLHKHMESEYKRDVQVYVSGQIDGHYEEQTPTDGFTEKPPEFSTYNILIVLLSVILGLLLLGVGIYFVVTKYCKQTRSKHPAVTAGPDRISQPSTEQTSELCPLNDCANKGKPLNDTKVAVEIEDTGADQESQDDTGQTTHL